MRSSFMRHDDTLNSLGAPCIWRRKGKDEMGWNSDAIERQLAHGSSNELRRVYNYAQYLPMRRRMMQAWADYLDSLRLSTQHTPAARETTASHLNTYPLGSLAFHYVLTKYAIGAASTRKAGQPPVRDISCRTPSPFFLGPLFANL